ncbi:hypothetical protein MNBD_ALPHA12-1164 [hydrothermal vent metagenome]|uniref:DUF2336 domain-containing protein n=1 Tax=hydrothermal vent metagenome TaxID=652676 RepID=A0A3B0TNG5_9ZZZZ
MLADMVDLAREKSSEKRRELMGRIADHFAEGSDNYSDQELKLFSQIISKLLEETDVQSRYELSEKISRNANTPHDITLQLANEEIKIARPMLENSPNLTPDDLLHLVTVKGMEHRLAISLRPNLNEKITDKLIQHGECEILRAISGNKGARFSDWGFGALAQYAPGDELIQNNLAKRADMSLTAAKKVLPLLAPGAQQKLLSLIKDDEGELLALVAKAVHDASLKNIENKVKRIDAKKLLAEVRANERTLDCVIIILAKEDRPMDCAMVLSKISQLPENQVAGSLLRIEGDSISLLCKALNISTEAFYELSVMRYSRLNLPLSKADQLAEAYEEIDVSTAQRVIRFVKVRNTVSGISSAA